MFYYCNDTYNVVSIVAKDINIICVRITVSEREREREVYVIMVIYLPNIATPKTLMREKFESASK